MYGLSLVLQRCTCATQQVHRSEDNLQEVGVASLPLPSGFWDQTRAVKPDQSSIFTTELFQHLLKKVLYTHTHTKHSTHIIYKYIYILVIHILSQTNCKKGT